MSEFENIFSRRNKLVNPSGTGKPGELSDSERTKLWNVLYEGIRRHYVRVAGTVTGEFEFTPHVRRILRELWTEYFGRLLDEYGGTNQMVEFLRSQFLTGTFHVPLDVLEILIAKKFLAPDLQYRIEQGLHSENSFYQLFEEGKFVPRLPPEQRESLETALEASDPIRIHLETALRMLRDREHPDFRNSIKESISAVESACQKLTGLEDATLTQALKKLHATRPLHEDFRDALQKLYWWTSDDSGIRHCLSGEPTTTLADAQFTLVACSAFVNYLLTR
jgi:hypothetical protein